MKYLVESGVTFDGSPLIADQDEILGKRNREDAIEKDIDSRKKRRITNNIDLIKDSELKVKECFGPDLFDIVSKFLTSKTITIHTLSREINSLKPHLYQSFLEILNIDKLLIKNLFYFPLFLLYVKFTFSISHF